MSKKGPISRNSLPPYGIDPIQAEGRLPWILTVPKEPYYEGVEEARQYLPISLRTLQRLIDLRRINPSKPIDLPVLCNTKLFSIQPDQRQFGLQLTDDGADLFSTPINLEIQWVASELAIAAIERCGGVLTTRYFDPISLAALIDAKKFFERGEPIPRCDTPPINAVEYYTDPKQRGYLANPDLIREERQSLAQKYGYKLPDSSKFSPLFHLRKDPRQIFYGLEPGWLINLKDQTILKPTDEKFQTFYHS
jgi:large subunit ribosomal protein L15